MLVKSLFGNGDKYIMGKNNMENINKINKF